jgi:hypothetical protein
VDENEVAGVEHAGHCERGKATGSKYVASLGIAEGVAAPLRS